jgi:hypothetical protein
MEMTMEEKMRRDAGLRYIYPLCHMFVLNFYDHLNYAFQL